MSIKLFTMLVITISVHVKIISDELWIESNNNSYYEKYLLIDSPHGLFSNISFATH